MRPKSHKEGVPNKAPTLVKNRNTATKNKTTNPKLNKQTHITQETAKIIESITEHTYLTDTNITNQNIDLIAKNIKHEQITEEKTKQKEAIKRPYVNSGKYRKIKEDLIDLTNDQSTNKAIEINTIVTMMLEEDKIEFGPENLNSIQTKQNDNINNMKENVTLDLLQKLESHNNISPIDISSNNISTNCAHSTTPLDNINIYKPKSKFNVNSIIETYKINNLLKENALNKKLNNDTDKENHNLSLNTYSTNNNKNHLFSLDNTTKNSTKKPNQIEDIITTFQNWEYENKNCRNIATQEAFRLQELTRTAQIEGLKYQQLVKYTKSETERVTKLINDQIEKNKQSTQAAVNKLQSLSPEKTNHKTDTSHHHAQEIINNISPKLSHTQNTSLIPKTDINTKHTMSTGMDIENTKLEDEQKKIKDLLISDPSKVTLDMLKTIGVRIPLLQAPKLNIEQPQLQTLSPTNPFQNLSDPKNNTENQATASHTNSHNMKRTSAAMLQSDQTIIPNQPEQTDNKIYVIEFTSNKPIDPYFKDNSKCWQELHSITKATKFRAYIKANENNNKQYDQLIVETEDQETSTLFSHSFENILKGVNIQPLRNYTKSAKLHWFALYVPFKKGHLSNSQLDYLGKEYKAEQIVLISNIEKMKDRQMTTRYMYKIGIPNEETYNSLINQKKIMVTGDIFKIEKWVHRNIVKRCNNCKQFGHGHEDCSFEWRCGNCGEAENAFMICIIQFILREGY
jgi:hypothetical protein